MLDPRCPEIGFLYVPHFGAKPHVRIEYKPCECGRLHAYLTALVAKCQILRSMSSLMGGAIVPSE